MADLGTTPCTYVLTCMGLLAVNLQAHGGYACVCMCQPKAVTPKKTQSNEQEKIYTTWFDSDLVDSVIQYSLILSIHKPIPV